LKTLPLPRQTRSRFSHLPPIGSWRRKETFCSLEIRNKRTLPSPSVAVHGRDEENRAVLPGAPPGSLGGGASDAQRVSQQQSGTLFYVHFVTHGTASRTRPLESAVILSRKAIRTKLYARDIVTRHLRAELVTISACYGSDRAPIPAKDWSASPGLFCAREPTTSSGHCGKWPTPCYPGADGFASTTN